MPFITSEETKAIRTEIKKSLPDFKVSVTKQHHSSVTITILEGKVDFGSEYVQVNHYCYKDHYKNNPEALAVFDKIMSVLESLKPQKEITYDSDYGSVPNYYLHIHVGQWDKKYKKVA